MRTTIRLLLAVLVTAAVAPGAAHAAFSFTRTDVPLTAGPTSLAIGDIDAKNGPDIVATLYTDSGPTSIAVLLNNGDGTFAGPTYYPTCDGATDTELGDVTTTGSDLAQDGKLDVVVACLRVLPGRRPGRMAGDGAGGFGAAVVAPNLPIGQVFFTDDPIELANVREGGGPPLLVYMTDFYNLGTGEQGKVACVSWDWVTNDCFNRPDYPKIGGPLISGRLNGTARDQILTGGGKGFVTYGIADGLPNGPSSIWTFSDRDAGGAASWMRLADTDGDGHVDVITSRGDSMGGSFSIQHWGATGIVDGPAKTTKSVEGLEPTVVGDFNGDGHPDVLGVTAYGRAVAYAGDGADNFTGAQDVPLLGYGNPSFSTVVQAEPADIDRDGRPDAVVADVLGSNIQILRNTTPLPPKPTPTPAAPPPAPKPLVPLLPLTGIKGVPAALTVGATTPLALGSAANPPTASVDLTIDVKGAAHASKAKAKTTRIGAARVKIPAGKTRKLQLKLNAAGRKLLKARRSIKATLTLVATGTDGSRATKTRSLTLKRAAVKHRKH